MWFLLFVIQFLILLLVYNSKAFKDLLRRINLSRSLTGPDFSELLSNSKNGRVLQWLRECQLKYGTIFRVWLGPDLFLFLSDPDDVKAVLSSNQLLSKSRNYQIIEPWLGRGLLTNGGRSWHNRRKLLTPAFHFKILSQFKQPMEDNCNLLIEKLTEVADGREVNVYSFITLFALDVICETAMGIKRNAQIQSDSEYVRAVNAMCRIGHKQSFTWWARSPFLFSLSKMGKERDQSLKILHGETNGVIQQRRKLLENEDISQLLKQEDDIGSKRRLAFLDMLLISQMEGGELTDADIREEVDTFMFEGHDTTSSTLSFAFYLLSTHKDVQDKLYEEVQNHETQDIEQMKYLEAVIKETLRLYPAVPFYSRKLTDDFKLREMVIPRGTSVSTFAYMVHRNPDIYPDPDAFNPERFLNNEKEIHPYAFVAFSAGPRNCIGQRFAMLELRSTISKLINAFEFLPADNFTVEPTAELVLKSRTGFMLKIRPRTI